MNDNLQRAVDAYSASPAIRIRHQVIAAKPQHPMGVPLPPPIEHLAEHSDRPPFDAAAAAARAGHPAAILLRLRQEAANEIERLLIFLDATEGDPDMETNGDDDAQVDDDGIDEASDNEPELGFSEPIITGDEMRAWWPYMSKDARQWPTDLAETLDRGEGADDDSEPSLCGVSVSTVGNDLDLEDDCEDEPSLGWTRTGAFGNALDLEMTDFEA